MHHAFQFIQAAAAGLLKFIGKAAELAQALNCRRSKE